MSTNVASPARQSTPATKSSLNGATSTPAASSANGRPPATSTGKRNTKTAPAPAEPPDPVKMYESVRSRIAALEEEEGHEEEEDRKTAEDAHSSVRGMSDSAIHQKYVDLYQEMRRNEREYAKERQKLTKDKDSAKSQFTKSNQARTKLENLARELQKDNKRLREDSKRLLSSVEDAQDVIESMKAEIERRVDDVRARRDNLRDQRDQLLPPSSRASSVSTRLYPSSYSSPNLNFANSPLNPSSKPQPSHTVGPSPGASTEPEFLHIKVTAKYRAELWFKVSRKTKLSRLFKSWTERMELSAMPPAPTAPDAKTSGGSATAPLKDKEGRPWAPGKQAGASGQSDPSLRMAFIFTRRGRVLEGNMSAAEAGLEDSDEILAVEVMDLTEEVENAEDEGSGTTMIVEEVVRESGASEDVAESVGQAAEKLKKVWPAGDVEEAKRATEEIFDLVVRDRLRDLLRQYALRERHFESIVRSKELEVLLARARAEEARERARNAVEGKVVASGGADKGEEGGRKGAEGQSDKPELGD